MNHIHLGTKDLAQSMDFYQKFFGFQKKFDHGEGAFLEDKNGFLLAIDPVDSIPEFPSWFHLGFCLDSLEAVKALYDSMNQAGVKFYSDYKEYDGEAAAFYALDPDGFKIEVSWHQD